MISNLRILQCAHQHLNDPTIDVFFKRQLLSIISESRDNDTTYISTSHKTEKINSFAATLFPQKKLDFFNRLHIGNLLLCTFPSAVSKSADDSTVLFRVGDKLSMGRIKSIFTLSQTDNTFLLVDYPTTVNSFTCFIGYNDEFIYPSIQSCFKKDFSTRLIQTADVVEKCVYFENPNGKCHFMRFPNLEHSS